MPFKKGERLPGQGGLRKNAGRKPKVEVEIQKAAALIAREFIESNVQPILNTYKELATGRYVKRYTALGTEYEEWVVDAATTRHAIDKILPDDKDLEREQTLNIFIAQRIQTQDSGLEPEFRSDSLQIRIGGGHGQNGNGSNGS